MEINKSSKKFQNEDFVVIKLNDEILSLNNNDAIKEYFDNELTAGNKNFIIEFALCSTAIDNF